MWYLTRATGLVSLVLLTLTVVLGIVDVSRWSRPGWPRFVVDGLHRSVALLAASFLGVHVATTVIDGFTPISLLNAIVPFTGTYRPLWIGFGALSLDLLIAVGITSLLRRRLGLKAWRAVHWLAYASWPVALLHSFGSGSDVQSGWMLAVALACVAVVLVAVWRRIALARQGPPAIRLGALTASAIVPIGLLVWLPSGPLAQGWARRAGTPPVLLGGSRAGFSSPSSGAARTAAPADPFAHAVSSAITGTIASRPGSQPGFSEIDIAAHLAGGPGELRVRLDGPASPGGGLSLSDGSVTLATAGAPDLYSGPVVGLEADRIFARVRSSGGAERTVRVTLRIGGGGTVGGSLDVIPAGLAG